MSGHQAVVQADREVGRYAAYFEPHPIHAQVCAVLSRLLIVDFNDCIEH